MDIDVKVKDKILKPIAEVFTLWSTLRKFQTFLFQGPAVPLKKEHP